MLHNKDFSSLEMVVQAHFPVKNDFVSHHDMFIFPFTEMVTAVYNTFPSC